MDDDDPDHDKISIEDCDKGVQLLITDSEPRKDPKGAYK